VSGTLEIFVAMPGTDMGPEARWKDPASIKRNFFEPIRDMLKDRLKRDVTLVVEKDRKQAGVIYKKMFEEALEADVYIADITGNNPNVYLELGVRWALRDKVTIVVRQEKDPPKFNVAANRSFQYSNDLDHLKEAIEDVVSAIKTGLDNQAIDSPVVLHVENLPRYSEKEIRGLKEKILQLENEVKRLESLQGRDYLAAGRASDNSEYRLQMFRKAVETNPNLFEAHFELGLELRKLERYDEAIVALKTATRLESGSAQYHRELGVAYNKMGMLNSAIDSLKEAVRIDEKDADALGSLGGALRKLGMKELLKSNDWTRLHEAKDSYAKASELDKQSNYAVGNVARLYLLLSKTEPTLRSDAIKAFKKLRYLTEFKLLDQPDDYWLRFDLADTYLLTGEVDQGYRMYQEASKYVPGDYQADAFSSVASPLKEFLSLEVVDDPIKATIEKILKDFDETLSMP
jgi:tetratricopeptide (TPR) repeat protein